MKYLLTLFSICLITGLSAQVWLPSSSARAALDVEEDLLRAEPSADLTKSLDQYSEDEILNTIKREMVRDYSAILVHSPNLELTLNEYFAKDQLLNSKIVTDSMKMELRKYLMRQISKPTIPK